MEVDRCGRITLLEFLSKTPTNTTSGNLHIQSQGDQMTPPPTSPLSLPLPIVRTYTFQLIHFLSSFVTTTRRCKPDLLLK